MPVPPTTVETYAADIAARWWGARSGIDPTLRDAIPGDPPVFLAGEGGARLALAVAPLWDAAADDDAEAARAMMEERLNAGSVRGPLMVWAPPRASVPAQEPEASDFVLRAQVAAASLPDGGRGELELPVKIQVAKTRDEGGYASVIGGMSRWWTNITDRVDGTFQVNSMQVRRMPQSEPARDRVFDEIARASKVMTKGDAVELEAAEAWTLQRLVASPLDRTGFAIVQAPPNIDPSDGTLMRRLVRRRLKDAAVALAPIEAETKGVALMAIYEYAEHENVGSFLKSLDPGLYAPLPLILALVDGEVRPIFVPR